MKKLSLIFLVFISHSLYSQHVTGTSPSPGTLGGADIKSSQYVDFSTGTANVTLPLTDIKADDFVLPISLNYQSKGLNVEDISSWVGIDWYLNAGGSISRTVLGYPDDYDNGDDGVGILHTPTMQSIFNLPVTNGTEESLGNSVMDYYGDHKDTQPDIFVLNIASSTIKFVFDTANNIKTIDNSNYKITYTLDTAGKLKDFKVIDIYGNSYLFSDAESTTETSSYASYNYDSHKAEDETSEKTFNSTWRLTQIITTKNKLINFVYRTETIEYDLKKLELYKICKNNDCNTYLTLSPEFKTIKLSKIKIVSKVIKEINYSDIKIAFTQSSAQRQDLKGSYKLLGITKSSSVSGQLLNYTFDSNNLLSPGTVDPLYPYKHYRLKLNSISCNGNIKYRFTYNTLIPPNLHSSEQDFWGYYNGNQATSLIPTTYVYPNTNNLTSFYIQNQTGAYFTIPGVNRQSNATYCESGMLKILSDELGNTVNFDYELNKFLYNGVTFTGNGLRVKKLTFREGTDYQYDKNIFYEDNGVNGFVELLPSFSYYVTDRGIRYVINGNGVYHETPTTKLKLTQFISGQGYPPVYSFVNDGASNWTEYYKHFYATMRFSTTINATMRNNYSVNYLKVREGFGDINTTYNYIRNTAASDFPGETNITNTVTRRVRKLPENSNFAVNPESLTAQNPYYWDKDFPYIPNYFRSWNPTLLKEVIHNSGSVTRKKEVYDYTVIAKNWADKQIYGLKYDLLERPNPSSVIPNILITQPYLYYGFVFARYPIILGTEKKLTKHTITEYSAGQELQKVTDYYYNDKNLISRIVSTSSDNENLETITKYPHELSASQTIITQVDGQWVNSTSYNSYGYMTNNNAFNYPVEVIQKRNGEVIGATATTYNWQAINNPEGLYNFASLNQINKMELEIAQPITNFQPGSSNNLLQTTFDSRMKIKSTNHQFDTGNVIYYSEKGGAKTVYIYGYRKKLLIAKLENMNLANIPTATLTNLTTLSDQDNDNCQTPTCKEQLLRVALNNLRTAYPQAMVTTYTYDPSIGMTSETDSKGETKYYKYDNLQRLIEIRDVDRNVINSYKYHTKTQTN